MTEVQSLRGELVEMIADVAIMATERHLEVVSLIKGQGVEIAVLRSDIDHVKADVGQLKVDVGELKSDVGQLKTDVGQLKVDMVQVKADIGAVKTDVSQVQVDLGYVRADVSSIRAKLVASDLAADRRHDELLDAIRGTRSVSNIAFGR